MDERSGDWAEKATRLWAFLEASFWYVIPDAWLMGLCAVYPDRARRLTRICWTTSTLGIGVCWLLCCGMPEFMRQQIYSLPFTLPEMGAWIVENSQSYGVLLSLYQPYSNAPVKVWVIEATTTLNWNGFLFLVLVAASRGVRMIVAAQVGAWAGRRIPLWCWRHGRWLLTSYVALVMFLLWWTSKSYLRGY